MLNEMKKTIVGSILCLLYSTFLLAQVNTAWVARYNGPGNDYDEGTVTAVDGQGNVYVTGYSIGLGTNADYATIKYDSDGVEQWVQRYNGPGNIADFAYALAVDAQGNVYVSGYSSASDFATIKYDSDGVEQWVQRHDGEAYSIAVDEQGNVYVAGSVVSGPNRDYLTIKYNMDGVLQWLQTYNNGATTTADAAFSMAIDGQGNVYVTGESYGNTNGTSDYATIKYDSDGVLQWLQRYNGPADSNEQAYSLAVDIQANVYVTGMSYGGGGGGTENDCCTIKYNTDGVEQWVQRYNGSLNACDIGYSIAVDGQGNAYVTGDTSGPTDDSFTIKYNTDGVEQWLQIYNGPANDGDYSRSIEVDGQGNAYVTGWTIVSETDEDYLTIKYNSAGVEEWVQTYNGTGNGEDHSWPLAVDEQGNVYVSGYSVGSGGDADYATIKYGQVVSINENSVANSSISNLSNYPNPFNPSTMIKFSLHETQNVIIDIYNTKGEKVRSLVNDELEAGSYNIPWNGKDDSGKNTASGVYFYKMKAGKFVSTKKMMLLK